ncbi:hypothetical protein D3C81_1751090 [compost metagenome]
MQFLIQRVRCIISLAAVHTADNRPLHCFSCPHEEHNAVQQLRQFKADILLPQPYLLMEIANQGSWKHYRQKCPQHGSGCLPA